MAISTPEKLRIAIAGGGAAGICLLHALLDTPHLDVRIFEAVEKLKTAGAAIGFQRNVLQALELLSPTARECLDHAGMVPLDGHQIMLGEGPDAGAFVARTSLDGSGKVLTGPTDKKNGGFVSRATFLEELLKNVPPDRIHTSKKLLAVEQGGEQGPVTLRFADGTLHECDVLIGADGIHSTVRKYVLGSDDPAATPVPAGWWAVPISVPYSEAQACLGKEFVNMEETVQYSWIGEGKWIMHAALSGGKEAQFVAAVRCEESMEWWKTIQADELRELFKDFAPPLDKAVETLLCTQSTRPAFYFWEHLHARTYARGNVALMGDAAHATTPWQASGAGMSIEDALILSTVLQMSISSQDARIALQVYDETRRPLTQRIVDSSRGTGMINTGVDPETGLDLEKIRQKLPNRWNFIRSFDNAKLKADAVRLMEIKLQT